MGLARRLIGSQGGRPSDSASVGDFGLRMRFSSIRSQFLDRQQIMNRYDKAALKGLTRFGGLTRTISRRSMRVRKTKAKVSEFDPELKALLREDASQSGRNKPDISPWPLRTSKPGSAPFARNRQLKDKIFFVADKKRRSVVIGPQIRAGTDDMGSLETGGFISKPAKQWVKFYDQGVRKIRLVAKGGRRVRLKARPYMKPAYDKAVETLIPGIWQNSL